MSDKVNYTPEHKAFLRKMMAATKDRKAEEDAEKALKRAADAAADEQRRIDALPFCIRPPLPETLSEVPDFMEKVKAFFIYHPSGDLLCSWRAPNELGRIVTKRRGVHGKGYADFWGMQAATDDIVWLLHHGAWPAGKLRHIDGDWRNDRIENLREPLANENPLGRAPSRGVARSGPHHWQAYVKIDGVQKNLGRFKTEAEAIARRGAWDRGEDLV